MREKGINSNIIMAMRNMYSQMKLIVKEEYCGKKELFQLHNQLLKESKDTFLTIKRLAKNITLQKYIHSSKDKIRTHGPWNIL